MLDFLVGVTVISVIFDWGGGGGISWVCVCGSVGKQHQYPWKMDQNHNKEYICLGHNPGGGGYSGYIGIYIGRAHKKRGVLGAGTAQKGVF